MVRPADHVFRYGGEEFVVLAPETDATGALALAERIRETVAATAFPVSAATDAKLTISIGVTSFLAEGGRKEDLIVQADTALYAAKSAGRNRTHLYQPPEPDRRDATNIC
jgi:diguanylate cyclase (GGDEF)-like protein